MQYGLLTAPLLVVIVLVSLHGHGVGHRGDRRRRCERFQAKVPYRLLQVPVQSFTYVACSLVAHDWCWRWASVSCVRLQQSDHDCGHDWTALSKGAKVLNSAGRQRTAGSISNFSHHATAAFSHPHAFLSRSGTRPVLQPRCNFPCLVAASSA